MERTFTTAQEASRLHRGGSNAEAKVYPQANAPLLSTMAAGSECDKKERKEPAETRPYDDHFSRTPDKYVRMANVLESYIPC
jgi:hypothetical protein